MERGRRKCAPVQAPLVCPHIGSERLRLVLDSRNALLLRVPDGTGASVVCMRTQLSTPPAPARVIIPLTGTAQNTPNGQIILYIHKYAISRPKTARKEFDHTFRLDVETSKSATRMSGKYILAAESRDELQRWMDVLGPGSLAKPSTAVAAAPASPRPREDADAGDTAVPAHTLRSRGMKRRDSVFGFGGGISGDGTPRSGFLKQLREVVGLDDEESEKEDERGTDDYGAVMVEIQGLVQERLKAAGHVDVWLTPRLQQITEENSGSLQVFKVYVPLVCSNCNCNCNCNAIAGGPYH